MKNKVENRICIKAQHEKEFISRQQQQQKTPENQSTQLQTVVGNKGQVQARNRK